MAVVGAGSFIAFVGTIVLGPTLVGAFAALTRPVEGWFTARLARRNSLRNPRRAAATASALTIGVALVALFAIVVSSVKVTVTDAIDSLIGADVVVDANTFGQAGFDPAFLPRVSAVPGVERAVGIELGFATVDGTPTQVIGADMAELTQVVHLDEARGALTDLDPDELAIDTGTAATKGWGLGSVVPTSLADPAAPGATPVRVGAIFDTGGAGSGFGVLMSRDGFNRHFPIQQQTYNQLFVTVVDGASNADVERSLTELVAATYPSAHVRDLEAYKQAQSGLLDVVLSTVGALVVLAIGIAVLGIANTLALSVHERAREIAVLRAVGMTRRQVRATVRWESILFAIQGATTGAALGIAIGWALVSSLTIQGSTLVFAMPWALLLGTIAASIVAGLLAAQLPAIAASRLRPVAALRV
jgi:putative ABC transport system permease protein